MALPREEQAKIMRILSSMLSARMSLKDALLNLAEDYRDYGMISVPPEFSRFIPKEIQKGWVSEVLEDLVFQIDSGRSEEEVLAEAEIFDRDIRQSLSSAAASNSLQKVAVKLADFLELEAKLLGRLKKVIFAPTMAFFIAVLFTYVVVFRFVPKVVSTVNSPEKLPLTVKWAYTVSGHFFLFLAGILLLILGVVYFLRSGVWKSYLKVYREFEKLRFLSWLKILLEAGWGEVKVFRFLQDAGFSKKWREAIEDAIIGLEAGEPIDEIMAALKDKGLLKTTDLSFIKSGVSIGNIPKQIEILVRFLLIETEKLMGRTEVIVQTISTFVVGIYVTVIYIGIFLPLVTAIRRAMAS